MEKYEKILTLGQGASAEVFLMRDLRTKQLFAVKKVKMVPGKRLRNKEAVLQEVAILKQLRHPHVVACHDHFLDAVEKHVFIVQDYCDGGSLHEHILTKHGGYFSEGNIMRWFVQLALAIQYIHGLKILHRDIKASNVFLTHLRTLKLGDFGISKVLDSTVEMASTFVGTPYYLSPELCKDVPYSSKADIWALGCLLFELCALQPPFEAFSLIGLFHKIVREDHAPVPGCYSEGLRGLIRAILQKDPQKRPSATTILFFPFVQKHLSLFLLHREPQKPLAEVFHKRDTGGLSPPRQPPKPAHQGYAAFTPGYVPPAAHQQQAEAQDPEEGLSASSSVSNYSADFEHTSTSATDSSSDGDALNRESTESLTETESEWGASDYLDDFEHSEEGGLEETENDAESAVQVVQKGRSYSSPLGSFPKCRGGRGFSGSEDGSSCFSGSDDTTRDLPPLFEPSLSVDDTEPLEVCYLLRRLGLDSS
ncbi:uncharacterized protein LOC128335618 [Hemicordylus capensis]|uniref:uncharacterized protein LOC128335618 n=1 Tax=Hemicordylus capensis TaxID=884348 RepID=UPI002304A389|nr:uncharacterized protein LOC128335618 [Hemicordylus capensis]